MSNGFVLRLTPKDSEDNAFASAYEQLKGDCFADGAMWFGWNLLERELPQPFNDQALAADWEVVRVFSPSAELRGQRRGNSRLLLVLTEDEALVSELLKGLEDFQVDGNPPTFKAMSGSRIFVGRRPSIPIGDNPDALIEVALPRELDYHTTVSRGEALVAKVQCYLDEEGRLRFVRYCSVRPKDVPMGDLDENDERRVKPLCSSEDKSISHTN